MGNPQDDRDRIVELHADTVWRIALSRTGKEDAAEEVFQETFMALFEKERTFTSEEHRKAWLIRTALVCCKHYMSLSFRTATVDLEEVASCLAMAEEDKSLYRALMGLPVKYRIPIQLYYIEGVSGEDCAQILKIPSGTFRSRLSRGKQLLRELLKGENVYV